VKIKRYKTDGVIVTEVKALKASEERLPSSWFGYASLELIVPGRTGHELDLVVVTDDRIILVDFKEWQGVVSCDRDRWLQNGADRGRSAVIKLREAARQVSSKLSQRLQGKRSQAPYVDYLVVFTGGCRFESFPQDQLASICLLPDFLALGDARKFRQLFPRPFTGPSLLTLKSDLDTFFLGQDFRAADLVFANYKAQGESIFVHPQKLFREFRAQDITDTNFTALLRLWDLDKLPAELNVNAERARLVTREKRALGYLRGRLASEIEEGLALRLLVADDADPVSTNHFELYSLARDQERLDEFLERHRDDLGVEMRHRLMTVLLGKFAALHEAGLAHRDVGTHCIWVQQPNRIALSGFATAHFPDILTLGDRRKLLASGDDVLPEDILGDGSGDPLRRDVFSMAAVLARLAYQAPLPVVDGVPELPPPSVIPLIGAKHREWLARALDPDVGRRPADARELMKAFEAALPEQKISVDTSIIDRHRTDAIPFVIYRADGPVTQRRSTQYQSGTNGSSFVKIWTEVANDAIKKQALQLTAFLESASELKATPNEGVSAIQDFGLSPVGLFLVTEFVPGHSLAKQRLTQYRAGFETTVSFLRKLVDVVVSIHERGLAHGDLKPEHVILAGTHEAPAPFLIDLLDYSAGGELANSQYAPPRNLGATAQERDCYATAKIAVELLQDCLGTEMSEAAKATGEALLKKLQVLIAPDAPLLKSLGEIRRLLEPKAIDSRPIWRVDLRLDTLEAHELLVQETGLLITFKEDRRQKAAWRVGLHGLEETITLVWHPNETEVRQVFQDPLFEHQRVALFKRGVQKLVPARIQLRAKPLAGVSPELLELIRTAFSDFQSRAGKTPGEASRPDSQDPTSPPSGGHAQAQGGEGAPVTVTEERPESAPLAPNVSRIWTTLVSAESRILPSVTVVGDPVFKNGLMLVPAQEGPYPLEFGMDEEVDVFIRLGAAGEDKKLGQLDLSRDPARGPASA
jgi:hypothetical protein